MASFYALFVAIKVLIDAMKMWIEAVDAWISPKLPT